MQCIYALNASTHLMAFEVIDSLTLNYLSESDLDYTGEAHGCEESDQENREGQQCLCG